jgi:transcription termination factor NusB
MIKKYDDADKVKPFVNGVLNAVLKAKKEGGEG